MKKLLGYTLLVFMFLGIMAFLVWKSVLEGRSLDDALMAMVFTILAAKFIVGIVSLSVYLINSDK